MKLKDENRWNDYVSKNTDPYGGACVKVARRVMELLDENPEPLKNGYYPNIQTAHGLICKADDDTNTGGMTGFMEECVAQMVFECHERGDEFRKSYNGDINTDGDVERMVGKQFKHRNGNVYTVLLLTNIDNTTERFRDHPIDVVYMGRNGKIWSRPLSDWDRSFTEYTL